MIETRRATAILEVTGKGRDEGFFRYLTKHIMVGEFMDRRDAALKYSAAWAGSAKSRVKA